MLPEGAVVVLTSPPTLLLSDGTLVDMTPEQLADVPEPPPPADEGGLNFEDSYADLGVDGGGPPKTGPRLFAVDGVAMVPVQTVVNAESAAEAVRIARTRQVRRENEYVNLEQFQWGSAYEGWVLSGDAELDEWVQVIEGDIHD
jgi:hypothetical protein